ncbi:MAG: DUF928 domain-containing protein [Leptolyngbyaceae cyanobacterium]
MHISSKCLKALLLATTVSVSVTPLAASSGVESQKVEGLHFPNATWANENFLLKDDLGDTGRPPKRASGGSRGPCLDQLIALMPGAEEIGLGEDDCGDGSDAFSTDTVGARPIFWFYVPDTLPPNTVATLTLVNISTPRVNATKNVLLPEQAGLIAIQSDHELNVGDIYGWDFEIQLYSGSGSSRNPTVNGVIRRQPVTAEIAAKLNSLEAAEKSNLYLQNGLWNDALNELAKLRVSTPEDLAVIDEWQSLFTQAGLSVLSQQSILDCCVDSNN